ncbi:MAG: DNA polymerase III subunit delta [Verrucomicrobia bacterium]|nr:DNA polymerase III subunit delta [Verrucomicrobiota bacterium]
MPPAPAPSSAALVLICGEDDFGVKQRARRLYDQWCAELGGMDHEIIDAQCSNSGEALRALSRLQESLQTLPFFGTGKAIWFQNCSFLADDRTSSSRDVTETLASLADDLKKFPWDNVRLLISAGKVDRRKSFYKTVEKLGTVELFAALSLDDKEWAAKAEEAALKALRALKKSISDDAVAELVTQVGPNLRQLHNEIEKLSLYVGHRTEIEVADVRAIVTRTKQARAFALADALGNRDLPKTLACLDEEMWSMRFDKDKSEIGLLYGLISKVRAMILIKEMQREKWIKPDAERGGYGSFKSQLERIPTEKLPEDKRFNPLSLHPYVLFNSLPQARKYTLDELVRAMELLLDCNRKLISSPLEEKLVLQQVLVQIARGQAADRPSGLRAAA